MIEHQIFHGLISNLDYARKVLPHLKPEYFSDVTDKKIFDVIEKYYDSYNASPSRDAVSIELSNVTGITDEQLATAIDVIKNEISIEDKDVDWLVDATEEFCKDKAIYNALMEGIQVVDKNNKKFDRGMLPELFQNALSVSFDNHIGHDYIDDALSRFDFYNAKEEKIPFDLDYMNKITKGGLSRKTLNIILAGTGVGKSLFMCHCAAANLTLGKNVLYITMEMAEEKIAERIDANLLNVTMDELKVLPQDAFEKKVERVAGKTQGKLIIKEYPTSSAHAGHFRHLLNELKTKRGFIPDIVYIDYINICASARLKGAAVNSYTYVKFIAEELRGLAVEFKVPIVSATQTTRTGYSSSDVGLEDTSESFGLPATADLMFAIISTEELEQLSQIMIKQLKNRYSDPNQNKRFVVGIDRAKMRLFNVEQSAQEDIVDDTPVFDNTTAGERMSLSSKFGDFI